MKDPIIRNIFDHIKKKIMIKKIFLKKLKRKRSRYDLF